MHRAQMWVDRAQLVENLGRMIRAGIVADDDLVVVRQLAQRAIGDDHDTGDGARVVVTREESGDRWSRSRGRLRHQIPRGQVTAAASAPTPSGSPVTRLTSSGHG